MEKIRNLVSKKPVSAFVGISCEYDHGESVFQRFWRVLILNDDDLAVG